MIPPASPFAFATAGEIRFGAGTAASAATGILLLGRRALVITGASPERARWLLDALAAEGADCEVFAVAGEPRVEDAETAAEITRAFRAEVVVGIGGGSAIDAAKAAAGLAPQTGAARDHLEVVGAGRALEAPPLPSVAIPTTAGTGAEVTRNAVLGVPEARRKVSLRDPGLLPRLAIVDPELTFGLPRDVTLASGLDALTQVIEPYVSSRSSPMTDALCRDAIPRALVALPRLMAGEDPEARADMALASLFGGIALANSGLGAVHGLAGVLGGHTGGGHGAICGRLLPHALAANLAATPPGSPGRARIATVAGWIGAALDAPADDAFAALAGWIDAAGLPRLGDLGVKAADHADIVAASRESSSMKGNPVALSTDALMDILAEAH